MSYTTLGVKVNEEALPSEGLLSFKIESIKYNHSAGRFMFVLSNEGFAHLFNSKLVLKELFFSWRIWNLLALYHDQRKIMSIYFD